MTTEFRTKQEPLSELDMIRGQVLPQMEAIAHADVLEVDEADLAHDADGVYRDYLPLEDLKSIPDALVAVQLDLKARLDNLVTLLGVITGIVDLFDDNSKIDLTLIQRKKSGIVANGMIASVTTNTSQDKEYPDDPRSTITFQYIPTGLAPIEIPLSKGKGTQLEVTAGLDIIRRHGEEGDHWLEVTSSRNLNSEEAKHGWETKRAATFFFDPRNPEDVFPYLRVRNEADMDHLAIIGSAAWKTGITAIHDTIDLAMATPWPTKLVNRK